MRKRRVETEETEAGSKPAGRVFRDQPAVQYRTIIQGIGLTARERHYILCLRDGCPSGFPAEDELKLNESIGEKCTGASPPVPFSELLRVMGLGDLELAAVLARGARFGDERDKAYFARLVLDRDRGEGKKRPKGHAPDAAGRPRGAKVAAALGDDSPEAAPPSPTADGRPSEE